MSGCIPGLRPGRLAHDLNEIAADGRCALGRRVSFMSALAVLACVACAWVAACALAPGSARAANVELFDVPTPSAGLSDIVAGPDGALWFNEQSNFAVGRITTTGVVTEYPIAREPYSALGDGPSAIVSSGGSLWTLANVGSTIDAVSTAGTATRLYANLNQSATNIVADGSGGVWAASLTGAGGGPVSGGLFRVDPPSGQVSNYRNPRFGGQFQPLPMAAGPDGVAWFADDGQAIRSIDPTGKITAYPIHGSGKMLVTSLALDRRGDVWFTEYVPGGGFDPSTLGAIGEIAAGSSTVTLTKLEGNKTPGSLVLGPDGGVWFSWSHGIGRIAPATGAPQLVSLGYEPSSLAFGADHNLWFTNPATDQIGMVQVAQLPIGPHTPLEPPTVSLGVRALATVATSRQLVVRCRLPVKATCAVTVRLEPGVAHKLKLERRRSERVITLGRAATTVARRGTARLSIPLSPQVAQAFRRRHVHRVGLQLTARATIVTGRTAKATRAAKLVRP